MMKKLILSSIIKEKWIHFTVLKLQKCFYENKNFKNFFCV